MATKSVPLSITDIVSTIIGDASSPIVSWLSNVINDQQSVHLNADMLCNLTHHMLFNYSITANETESKTLCLKLIESLQLHGIIQPFQEPFPVHTRCLALFIDDNEWYPATIIDITEPGCSYIIEFEGFEGITYPLTFDSLQHLELDKEEDTDPSSPPIRVSLKDSIQNTATTDVKLEQMMMSDVNLIDNGLKTKKYHNDLMELHEVNEQKLAMSLMDDDDVQFAEYANATEESDGDDDDKDNNDDALNAEKYIVIGADGQKRKIDPLNDSCALCERVMPLTWHHLVPKSTHDSYLKAHPKQTRLWCNTHGTWICRQCHSAIHGIHSNQELMRKYWTVDLLLECERVQKWIKYIAKKKPSRHYDRRGKKQNVVAKLSGDRNDGSTKIKYIH